MHYNSMDLCLIQGPSPPTIPGSKVGPASVLVAQKSHQTVQQTVLEYARHAPAYCKQQYDGAASFPGDRTLKRKLGTFGTYYSVLVYTHSACQHELKDSNAVGRACSTAAQYSKASSHPR
ncbi:hypothetical protein J3458_003663 [Metarhizium acridum]|uniref:uncharacterized protein n=1 Tax=Metarhizium acridum TaxID=92637 RepID=UPI001C6CAEFC|nr:hypothetical protein J3458_003663 [Metarhizium acridum]